MVVTRRGFIGTVGVVALTAAIGHRAARAGSNAAPVKGGSLVYGVETEPSTLNPHLNGQAKAKLVLRNAYESLLARTADGG
jgi:peptide/nickel transport system substrate-binding protein